MHSLTTILYPVPPFSLALTAGALTSFQPEAGADVVVDGAYHRLLERGGRLLLLSVRDRGNVAVPKLEVTVTGEDATPDDLTYGRRVAAHILATNLDLRLFYEMAAGDPALAPAIERFYGLHAPRHPSVFEGLVIGIAGQQIAAIVARRIVRRLVEGFGSSLGVDGRLYRSFPSPEGLLLAGPEGLRGALLSSRKVEYVLGIAAEAARGGLELDAWSVLGHEEMVRQLCALRGVGRWTAEWVGLGVLGHPEAFPAGDLILRRVIAGHYLEGRELTEAEAREWAERWNPFKALATIYLFSAMRWERAMRRRSAKALSF